MIYNATLNEKICKSCTIYIVLLVIIFITSISISSAFIYFDWYLRRSNTGLNTTVNNETVIY